MKIMPTMRIFRIQNEAGAFLAGGLLTVPAWSHATREALAFPTYEHATAAKSLLRVWLDRAGYPASATTMKAARVELVSIPHSMGESIVAAGAALASGARYVLPLYVDGAPDWLFSTGDKAVTA